MQHLLGRHRYPLPLFGFRVELVNFANIDIMHLREEFALWYIAQSIARTHVAKTALRIHTKGVSTARCSGLVSKRIKLTLIEVNGMIPLAVDAVRTVALQIEIIAKACIPVVEKLQIVFVDV